MKKATVVSVDNPLLGHKGNRNCGVGPVVESPAWEIVGRVWQVEHKSQSGHVVVTRGPPRGSGSVFMCIWKRGFNLLEDRFDIKIEAPPNGYDLV